MMKKVWIIILGFTIAACSSPNAEMSAADTTFVDLHLTQPQAVPLKKAQSTAMVKPVIPVPVVAPVVKVEEPKVEEAKVQEAAPVAAEEVKTEPKEVVKVEEKAPVAAAKAPVAETVAPVGDKPAIPAVYFGFNKAVAKRGSRKVILKMADTLKTNPNLTVTLEGNTDVRGNAAYNLALGKRRARYVSRSLVRSGVHASQIKVVTNGSNKPKLDCQTKLCWRENRRVDFVIR
jgi:peptidoglycan-associated lipoprotein